MVVAGAVPAGQASTVRPKTPMFEFADVDHRAEDKGRGSLKMSCKIVFS